MAFVTSTPKTINTTGASATGSDGASNRTYTISDSRLMTSGLDLIVNGATLHEGASNDYTISSGVITFLNALWDASIIKINYFVTSSQTVYAENLKYATTQQLADIIGVSSSIPSWDIAGTPTNEAVGIGDDSTTQFYLNQQNIIASSYTLYANAVAMTDVTHYALDLTTGEITLTAAGVTLLTTNALTAKYNYFSNGMSDAFVNSVLSRAEKEVENTTNTLYTDATQTNPAYTLETEIQPSFCYFNDQIITSKKPLIDVSTTLSGALTSSASTVSLAVGTGDDYPTTGNILVGSEAISYTGITTDSLTGCTRGILGTTSGVHSHGDAIHSTMLFLSNTSEGTAVTFTIQPWDSGMYATENGLMFSFADSVFTASYYPDRLTKSGVANRVKMLYYHGYDSIPTDITRLTLLFAKRQLITDNIGKAMIAGRNEFRPEMLNADMEEITRIVNSYIVFSMGNT